MRHNARSTNTGRCLGPSPRVPESRLSGRWLHFSDAIRLQLASGLVCEKAHSRLWQAALKMPMPQGSVLFADQGWGAGREPTPLPGSTIRYPRQGNRRRSAGSAAPEEALVVIDDEVLRDALQYRAPASVGSWHTLRRRDFPNVAVVAICNITTVKWISRALRAPAEHHHAF